MPHWYDEKMYGKAVEVHNIEDFAAAQKLQQQDPTKPIITNLYIYGHFLSGDKCAEIVETFRHLLRLEIFFEEIGDLGCQHLANLPPTIQVLLLERCRGITDKGLPYLAKIESLRELNLRKISGVTGPGLLQLAFMPNLVTLHTSSMSTGIDPADREAFDGLHSQNQAKRKSTPQIDFTPILAEVNAANGTSLTLTDLSEEMKRGFLMIYTLLKKKDGVDADLSKLYRESSWALSLIATYSSDMKIEDSDLQILVDNNINRPKFLKLTDEEMEKYNFSASGKAGFKKIINRERFEKLKRFPIVKEDELDVNHKNTGKLGAGGTAIVRVAKYLDETYAYKLFLDHIVNASVFQSEIRATCLLAHQNIVRTTHIVVDEEDDQKIVGLLMERLEGNLQNTIKTTKPTRKQLLTWLYEVARAVSHCHSLSVIHSDIKPENILISKFGEAKLTDFGSASVLNTTIRVSKGKIVGTPQFIAPEFAQTGATRQTDVFSFGMTIWALLHSEVEAPLGDNEKDVEANLAKGLRPAITAPDVSEELQDLIEKCWHQDPKERYSIKEVVGILEALSR